MEITGHPISGVILIKPIKEEDITPAGIIIPSAAKENPVKGRVCAVGMDEQMLSVGDLAYFPRGTGLTIDNFDEEYIILKSVEVLFKF